jgi:anti-anti-sigma factor
MGGDRLKIPVGEETTMVQYIQQDEVLECHFTGKLDTVKCMEMEGELQARVHEAKEANAAVLFDLQEVDFVASAFLRIGLAVYKQMGPEHFAMVNLKPAVKKVFMIAGFQELLRIE